MRPIAEKRHNDFKKAIRKRRIDRETDNSIYHHDWYDNLHQYSKNKIHCSCPLCCFAGKTMQDKRREEEMEYELDEYDLD